MRKITVLLVIVSLLAVLFCSLWIHESKARLNDMEQLCQYHASGAAGTLQEFDWAQEQFGEQRMSTYWYAVSRFYAFKETLLCLPDSGGWNELLYNNCHLIYDLMLHEPEKVLEHLDELLAALELLSEDYDSSAARQAMNQLSYNMQYDVRDEE